MAIYQLPTGEWLNSDDTPAGHPGIPWAGPSAGAGPAAATQAQREANPGIYGPATPTGSGMGGQQPYGSQLAPPTNPTAGAGIFGSGGQIYGQESDNSAEEDPTVKMLKDLRHRQSWLGFTPVTQGRARAERAMAALFQGVPAIRQFAIERGIAPNDWRTAVSEWASSQGIGDPTAYATEQGLMPKPLARTIKELVEERTLAILQGQGLLAPEMEGRVNSQLEALYQADLAGTEPPVFTPPEGGARFLPPVPSTQLWNSVLNAPEREGVADLFGAMGLTPEQLADQIRRLAPPAGGSVLANAVFRRG